MKSRKKNLAAIDIGTNSFHLVIAEVDTKSGRFRILDKEKEIVRLGSGSTDMKYLSDGAMNRGVAVLKQFRDMARSFDAVVHAVATSAVREAINRDEFLRRARAEAGIVIEIASGAEEARLIQLGVLQAFPRLKKSFLLVDIGGGSTEFLVGKGRQILYSNSLKLGAVRQTQRFFPSTNLSRRSVKDCSDFVKGMLAPVVRELKNHPFQVCLGTSGTLMNLANIFRARKGHGLEGSINGFRLPVRGLKEAVATVLSLPTASDRTDIPGIDPRRADIMPAGAIIAEQVAQELGLRELVISDYALREGILLDSIDKFHAKGKHDPLRDLRRSSVMRLAEQYRFEKDHALRVSRLSLMLFDQTRRLHGLGEEEREFLESAALLHEVGLFVSHDQHHRHSYYLIRHSDLAGFTENEKEIIANVARYHRKSHPKIKHDGYRSLTIEDQRTVTRLASILRLADGLDRSHSSAIARVRVRRAGRQLNISAFRRRKNSTPLESWGAERNKELFEATYRVRVAVRFR